jgi:hypothetical protein
VFLLIRWKNGTSSILRLDGRVVWPDLVLDWTDPDQAEREVRIRLVVVGAQR